MTTSTTAPSETRWSLYTSPTTTWEAIFAACKQATQSIDLEQFIFVDDEIGRKLLDICATKAQQGVRVRLLWDGAGSFNLFGNFLISELSQKHIQVAFFNTILPRAFHNHRWWFFRNHRRSIVIDKTIAFTGSFSIWEKTKEWRDTTVRIEGSIVASIEASFEVMWARAHNIKTDWSARAVSSEDGFSYVTNSPVPGKQFLYHRIIDAIRNARSYICITTPYFVPDRRLIRVLRLAARRNVLVQIIIPESSDHPVVDLGAESYFHVLLTAGVKIFRIKQPLIHSKSIVIDDDWATIGTMNLDSVSLHYNFEANIVSNKREFVEEIKTIFYQDLEIATEVQPHIWESRPFTQKWLEFLVRFVRTFL